MAKPRPLPQPIRTFSPAPGQPVDLALKTNLSTSYSEIPRLREWIGHLADFAGMSPVDLFDLRIAALEAFTHIVEEAYEGDEHGVVKATLLLRGEEVRLVLRDYGRRLPRPADEPESVPDPDGAHLFLMRRLVDEVKFHASLPRGTAVEIMKRLTLPPASPPPGVPAPPPTRARRRD